MILFYKTKQSPEAARHFRAVARMMREERSLICTPNLAHIIFIGVGVNDFQWVWKSSIATPGDVPILIFCWKRIRSTTTTTTTIILRCLDEALIREKAELFSLCNKQGVLKRAERKLFKGSKSAKLMIRVFWMSSRESENFLNDKCPRFY